MTSRQALISAGVLLALATLCGALGTHALKAQLEGARLEVWNTSVRYHFLQSLGLLGIGLCLRFQDTRALRAAALLISAGILLFCGSLYGVAVGAPPLLGALTPLGGLAWIVGWLIFAYAVWIRESKE